MKTPKWQLEDIYGTTAQLPCDFWAEYEFVPVGDSLNLHTITDCHFHVEFTGILPWHIMDEIRTWWDNSGPEFVQEWVRKEHEHRE